MKTKYKITTLDEHLDKWHGKKGTASRNAYQAGYEAFKLGVIIQILRDKQGMTQQQLADKCGTTKNYISRIENDASDMRVSTLMRIIYQGFGGHVTLSVDA